MLTECPLHPALLALPGERASAPGGQLSGEQGRVPHYHFPSPRASSGLSDSISALRCWLSSCHFFFLLKLFLNLLSLYFIFQLKVLLPPHPVYLAIIPGLSLFSMTGRTYV